MKYYYQLLCTLLPFLGMTQDQERIFNTDTFNHTTGVAYLDSTIFLLDSRGSYFDANIKRLWLYKLDMDLKTQDSVLIDNFINPTPGLSHRLHTISTYQGGLMLTAALDSATGNLNAIRESFILFLDKNLQLKRQFQVTDDSIGTQVMQVVQARDSLTVIGFKHSSKTGKMYPFLNILDSLGKTLSSTIYLDSNFDFPPPDTTILRQNKIMSFLTKRGAYYYASMNVRDLTSGLDVLAVLDSNYNIIETCHLRDSTKRKDIYMPGEWLLNNKNELVSFSLGVRDSFPPRNGRFWYYNVEVCLIPPGQICPTSCDTLPFSGFEGDNPYFSRPQITRDYLDYSSLDSVIFGITGKFINVNSSLEQDSTVLYLYNYNANQGRLNWRREIVTGNNIYWNTSVNILPGNRYLVAFNEQRWNVPHDNLRTRIMIFNGKGEVVSEREFTTPPPRWSVYPNPIRASFTLAGLKENQEVTLSWYDLRGQLLAEQTTKAGPGTLPPQLDPGYYLLQLRSEQGQSMGWQKVLVKK